MLLIDRKEPYGWGYTPITTEGEATLDTMIDFGILRLRAGEVHREKTEKEVAYLLMDGSAEFKFGDETASAERTSLFHESCPACMCLQELRWRLPPRAKWVAVQATTNPKFSHPSSTVRGRPQ